MASFRKAYLAKQRIAAHVLKQRGIHGIGVGMCDPRRPGKGAAIILYASAAAATANSSKKSPKKQKTINPVELQRKIGVPVRIVQSSSFHKHSTQENDRFRSRIRPVIGGYSIGTPDASGTAGLIIADRLCGSQLYVLSNNHVLVNENTRRCSKTLQPGGADGGTARADRIGELHRFVRLSKNRNNYLDAAMARPLRRSLLSPRYAVFGTVPGHLRSYRIGDQFKKVGRTTGIRTGRVESIHTDIRVGYGPYGNLGMITFKNQSVIRGKRPVSLSGDSGSVWLTQRGNLAAAVNFAGSDDGFLSISYPIEWFMQVFGTQVASPLQHRKTHTPARPGRRAERSYLYTQPLPPRLLRTIKPLLARRCPVK
ncbi:chymotrypsin family serine protease [Paenibacillus ihumii]|uniref:hypothetical protein n=1 Tax=Paenibacillus ihumii TaxID=687436 RepID=UPI0006D7CB26|nr:hypothetical protein [Paenibacillus ihumii]